MPPKIKKVCDLTRAAVKQKTTSKSPSSQIPFAAPKNKNVCDADPTT